MILKYKFHQYKSLTFINNINIDKLVVSNKVPPVKKRF